MTAMQSISTQSASSALRGGFVMAMRATLTISSGQPRHEWIIVSRWGNSGEHLAVGWTESPAMPGKTAPLHLVPRRTALAELICLPPCSGPLTFLFVPQLPAAVSVAGEFTPLEGFVRLQGRGARMRLCAEGRCRKRPRRPAWRIEAARAGWVGEFIESSSTET
jgi:hypothetical protein